MIRLTVLAVTLFTGTTCLAQAPGDILDLSLWKLTLPVDTSHEGKPDEYLPAELKTLVHPDHFFVTSDVRHVVFRAHCGGTTTKGSGYPRSELREMLASGRNASWSTTDAQLHALDVTLAVTHLPEKKPHVVCAQIHDEEDDVLMVRVEKRKLFIERPGEKDVLLSDSYELGTMIRLRIEASNGIIRVKHNGRDILEWEKKSERCYFKTGCYTQSNVRKGDKPESYAEVQISRLSLNQPQQHIE